MPSLLCVGRGFSTAGTVSSNNNDIIQELDDKDAQLQLFMADSDSVLEADICIP